MNSKRYFVTGIGTGVGKTIVSAILVEALKADYWKPVQSGSIEGLDSDVVKDLVSFDLKIHPEVYCFKQPLSPHAAAMAEKIVIDPQKINLPSSLNHMVIEGAGGLMVPLNDDYFICDLIQKLNAEVILVCRDYLGCINHMLLSIDKLKSMNVKVSGLIFNGNTSPDTERVILNYAAIGCLARISDDQKISAETVRHYASLILPLLHKSF